MKFDTLKIGSDRVLREVLLGRDHIFLAVRQTNQKLKLTSSLIQCLHGICSPLKLTDGIELPKEMDLALAIENCKQSLRFANLKLKIVNC